MEAQDHLELHEAKALMELLIVAAAAKTDEEKARVCWRASDHIWHAFLKKGGYSLGFCRVFNDLCQDQNWPWVKDLWSEEEIAVFKAEMEQHYAHT